MDVDLALVRRLEASAAITTLHLVEAMCANDPASRSVGVHMFGGALIATGPDRYVNRAMGVSLDERSSDEIDAIQQFYRDHELPAALEVASWAPPTTIAELSRRNFRLGWFRAMFAISPAELAGSTPAGTALAGPALTGTTLAGTTDSTTGAGVQIVAVDRANEDTWLQTFAVGSGVLDSHARDISDEFALATRACRDTYIFMATIGGQAAGCGTLQITGGIAWVGGAATLPEFRRRGVQAALLSHRVRLAADLECDLVAATAIPSGQSARNLVHLGFQHVQTQVVLEQKDHNNQV